MAHEIFDTILRAFGGAAYSSGSMGRGSMTVEVERFFAEIKTREADRNGPAEYSNVPVPDPILAEAVRRVLETHADDLEAICVDLIEQGWPT